MPFPLNLLGPRSPQPPRLPSPAYDEYDSSSSADSASTAKFHGHSTHSPRVVNHNELAQHTQSHHFGSRAGHRTSFVASSSTSLAPSTSAFAGSSDLHLHPHSHPLAQTDVSGSGRLSISSTATSTPVPSRSASPLPQFYSSASAPSSTYTSDADSEPTSPLLARNRKNRWWNDDGRRWWMTTRDGRRRRRRRDGCFSLRSMKRAIRVILRHPLFPTQPTSILLTLLVLTIVAILLTLLLIHILNPDKEPLPWRAYCSIPSVSTAPPSLDATSHSPTFPFNSLTPSDVSTLSTVIPPPFPPPNLDDYSPAGVFLGVFSMDSAVERRMLVRSTWASHDRSRNGAGEGDDGVGTSRTVVRFVLGKPSSTWEERVRLEAETYKDMIVLPIGENMNYGKTHAFFTWASTEAWVPPLPVNSSRHTPPAYSYSNITNSKAVPLAKHDPHASRQEWHMTGQQQPWVRPDFVVKVDDDSFVMLAELEARLRVELYTRTRNAQEDGTLHSRTPEDGSEVSGSSSTNIEMTTVSNTTTATDIADVLHPPIKHQVHAVRPTSAPSTRSTPDDPLVYWGYLVKNRFMAGELYALSWSIVEWASKDQAVKGMTKGKEDQQVAKWMRIHPRASDVRWKSERCWIYDHPKAATVYSHGFLFPSEVTRVRKSILSYLSAPTDLFGDSSSPTAATPIGDSSPTSWAYSSVSRFKARYSPPVPGLTTTQGIEALVEGSPISKLRDSGLTGETAAVATENSWMAREGRKKRYEEKRVGGTVVVHYIKWNTWFLETALAFLEGEELTEREMEENALHYMQRAIELAANPNTTESVTRTIATMHRRR